MNASILPLLFLSGIFILIKDPNAWYVTLSKVFPIYHSNEAMLASYFSPEGGGFRGRPSADRGGLGSGRHHPRVPVLLLGAAALSLD